MGMELDDEEEESGAEGWIVSYADLMTLLFAAFVVLYGITPQGKSKEILGITASIRESFVEIPDEIPESIRRAETFRGKLSFKKAVRETTMNPAIKKFNRKENFLHDKTKDQSELEMILKNLIQGEGLHHSLKKATQFDSDEYGFRLKLIDKAFFSKNRAKPTKEGILLMQDIAEKFQNNHIKIYIEGHTSQKVSGPYTALELSAERAYATRKIFMDAGIDASRIFIAGYGSMRPIDQRGSPKNNRIEIKVKYYERNPYGR